MKIPETFNENIRKDLESSGAKVTIVATYCTDSEDIDYKMRAEWKDGTIWNIVDIQESRNSSCCICETKLGLVRNKDGTFGSVGRVDLENGKTICIKCETMIYSHRNNREEEWKIGQDLVENR